MEKNVANEEVISMDEEREADVKENDSKESKADKSIRLAEMRINKLIQCFEQLKKLSNRLSYEFTQEQIDMICAVIDQQSSSTKQLFLEMNEGDKRKKFSFGSYANQ